ncbi:MAG: DinB family protein, partial [Anaerolineae bacterium]|nr:DinB family protein [Anaerolineae bacterium]
LYADQELSFKDLLAHLVTYEVYAVEAVDAWQQGEKHWITEAMRDPIRSRDIHYGGIAVRRPLTLPQMLEEWEMTQARLRETIAALSDDAWISPARFPTPEPMDLGGMLEVILVAPPRPMYRHLPVHIPDSADYIRWLRRIRV